MIGPARRTSSELLPDCTRSPASSTRAACSSSAQRLDTESRTLAKLLHVAGLYLGPEEDIVGAAPDNTDGFWENRRFIELNDRHEAAVLLAFAKPRIAPYDVLVALLSRAAEARLLARVGKQTRARAMAREAVQMAAATDALCDRARTLIALADTSLVTGDENQARAAVHEAETLYKLKGSSAGVRSIERILGQPLRT